MSYVTVQGDTWDGISLKTLGDERYMSQLIESNIEHADTVSFSAGVVLHIPDVKLDTSTALPPWKRGAI